MQNGNSKNDLLNEIVNLSNADLDLMIDTSKFRNIMKDFGVTKEFTPEKMKSSNNINFNTHKALSSNKPENSENQKKENKENNNEEKKDGIKIYKIEGNEEDIDSEEEAMRIIAKENEEIRKQMEEQELFFSMRMNGGGNDDYNNYNNKNNMLGLIQEVDNESDDSEKKK